MESNSYRSSATDSLVSRFGRSPSVNRSRPPSQGEGQLLRLHRSSSNGRSSSDGRASSTGRASTDKSMLPGHNQSAFLSSKLEATRQAFRASQASMGRPLSAGPRPRSSSVGRPGSSQLRGSDPSPLPPRREGERPRAYTCYLCGQQYGTASLMIHIPQCQKKWIAVEEQKPKRERRPLPPPPASIAGGQLPTGKGADDFNEEMYQHWDQKSLVGCPFCARTFRPEAFEKHKKVCTAANPGGPLGPGRNQVPRAGGAAAGPGRPASPARGPGGARPPSGGPPPGAPPSASQPRGGHAAAAGTKGSGGGGGMASKPLGFTCYLCGQQYGSASLIIHIGQCQKKWVSVESTKPKREQRPLPPPPPIMHDLEALPTSPQGIEDFNREMFAYWDKVSLVGCSTCGRTFRPDAFERHIKVCAPKSGGPGGGGSRGGRGGEGVPNHDSRPRAYNCYLCGQQYGSQSLLIHIPQCYEKWLKVEAAKPPKERREPPPPPPELDGPLPTHPDEIDAFNARMCGAFNDKSLMRCKHCGRSMRPDALSKHQRLCTADSPMKGGGGGASAAAGGSPAAASGAGVPGMAMGSSTGTGSPAEYADEGGEALQECEHCNRRMRPDALSKHQRICTADKPMKGVARQPQPPPQPRPPSAGMGAPRGRPMPQQPPFKPNLTPPSPRPYHSPPDQAQYNSKAYQEVDEAENEEEESNHPGGGASYGTPSYNNDPYGDMAGGDDDAGDRIPCDSCGRKFAPEAFAKHARVCAKVFANKRKPFNMAKQRLQGTDAASLQRAGRPAGTARPSSRMQSGQPARQPALQSGGAASSMPKWKAQSEALRQAMAATRQVNSALARGESLRNLPPPPSVPDPSFIQCPHCGRRFNQQAAERHIAACANTIAKPKFLKAGTGGSGAGAPQSRRLPRY